ncbi:hypothetical protein ACFLVR_02795 [Chloroflexota bacterium]
MDIDLHEPGLEQHPKSGVIIGNLIMAVWIALGTIACWFLSPIAAWIYLAIGVSMAWVVMRRLVCVNCYYYGKWCATGWGKLAAVFFKKGDMDKFSTSIGVKIAPMVYGLLSIIPITLLIVAMVAQFSVPRIVVLVLLIGVSAYSAVVNRKKTCAKCKMRLICPGCAVK